MVKNADSKNSRSPTDIEDVHEKEGAGGASTSHATGVPSKWAVLEANETSQRFFRSVVYRLKTLPISPETVSCALMVLTNLNLLPRKPADVVMLLLALALEEQRAGLEHAMGELKRLEKTNSELRDFFYWRSKKDPLEFELELRSRSAAEAVKLRQLIEEQLVSAALESSRRG